MNRKTDKQPEAKQLFMTGLSPGAIAEQLDISARTVQRWASDGKWEEERGSSNVVAFQATRKATEAERRTQAAPDRIDHAEILEKAILDVHSLMRSGVLVGGRDVAAVATALVKLLECHRKVCPPTIGELTEQVIDLGFSPHEFAQELRRQWKVQ